MGTDGGGSDQIGQVMSVEKCGDVVRAGLIHQSCGQPPALGAGWVRPMATGKGVVGSTPTGIWLVDPWPHTHSAASQQIPNALANQICGAVQRSQHAEHWESHTGSPGRLYWLNWLFFAEQRPHLGPACLIPWSRSMSHLKSYFYSFPPAPRLQAGFCTLISLCPSAAGAVASRHQD